MINSPENWPAIGFSSPDNYEELTEEEKSSIAELTEDFCIIKYGDQIDRFIRGVLFQPIIGESEVLHYGVWVSLSEKSFNDYRAHFRDDQHEATYFGFLCNSLNGYDSTMNIPANVICSAEGNRPEIVPHQSVDHPFVKDYYSGISLSQAEERIAIGLGRRKNDA